MELNWQEMIDKADWSEPERKEWAPEGRYEVKVIDCEAVTANTGNTGLEVFVEVVEGDHKGSISRGRLWQSDKPKGRARFVRTCELVTGVSKDRLAAAGMGLEQIAERAADLGARLNVVVEEDPGQDGRVYHRISWFNAPRGKATPSTSVKSAAAPSSIPKTAPWEEEAG